MRRLLVLALLLSLDCTVHAQLASDTLVVRGGALDVCKQLIAPVVLGGAGLGVHYLGHESLEMPLQESVLALPGHDSTGTVEEVVSVCRFLPTAAHLGLGMAGVPSRHALLDRSIESAIAHFFCYGSGFVAKKLFASARPDGSDSMSFPSGHCIVAFTGAELVRMDYGPWWGAGAYLSATTTAAGRIWGNHHWLGDVLAGAGLGILSAHVGGWLLGPVKSLLGIPESAWDGFGTGRVRMAVAPVTDPYSGALCMSLAIDF